MKIIILCENQVGEKGAKICLAEWGFSAFIQINDINILFDTGHTDVYKHNAKKLNINLENTDFVVLSHHHWDHVGGMQYHNFKTKKKLIIHPEIIEKIPSSESEKIKNDFAIIFSKKYLEFSKNIFYLGEIPRSNKFEKGVYKKDKMLDDSAIAVKTKKGVIVISGCSHSGICNICEHAKKITGQNLHAVIGGFHLFKNDTKAINGTIEYFKKENIEFLYPMHCIDFASYEKLYSVFNCKKISSGDEINFDL